jgi:hypothetical protein
MKTLPFSRSLLLALLCSSACIVSAAVAEEVVLWVDGVPLAMEVITRPAETMAGPDGRTIDIVGDTSMSSGATGRAKGNSYVVTTTVTLTEAEFYLDFTSSQQLTFYVFTSPVEFGTYTELYRDSAQVDGMGVGWYSTGEIAVELAAGNHYIIAVSWNGYLTYFFGTGDYQETSFGAYTHGYATGYDPLPATIESLVNDQAIYHQRLTTGMPTPADDTTWGAVKALYR